MVTVARFSWPVEAYLARCRLEACDIETLLPDEITTEIYWQYCNLLGGIRLQVNDEDAEDARAVLQETPQQIEEPILTDHERTAERALRSAAFGAFEPLFSLWSIWVLGSILFWREPMSGIERRQVMRAVVLITITLILPLLALLPVMISSTFTASP